MSDPIKLNLKHWLETWRQMCRQISGGCETCVKTNGKPAKEECETNFKAAIVRLSIQPEISISFIRDLTKEIIDNKETLDYAKLMRGLIDRFEQEGIRIK
jgi:hypothetical protein